MAVDAEGRHAGAAHGWKFQYAVRDSTLENVTVFDVEPLSEHLEL